MEKEFKKKIHYLLYHHIPSLLLTSLMLTALIIALIQTANEKLRYTILIMIIPITIIVIILLYHFVQTKKLLWVLHNYQTKPKEAVSILQARVDHLKQSYNLNKRTFRFTRSRGVMIIRAYEEAMQLLKKKKRFKPSKKQLNK